MSKVVADTCVWIDYFNRGDLESAIALDKLIETERVVVAGVVAAEILQGARSEKQAAEIESLLLAFPLIQEREATWFRVGAMSRQLRATGLVIPVTDLLLAQLAIENDCLVFSTDSHFDRIPNLPRFRLDQ